MGGVFGSPLAGELAFAKQMTEGGYLQAAVPERPGIGSTWNHFLHGNGVDRQMQKNYSTRPADRDRAGM